MLKHYTDNPEHMAMCYHCSIRCCLLAKQSQIHYYSRKYGLLYVVIRNWRLSGRFGVKIYICALMLTYFIYIYIYIKSKIPIESL